jgi:hypothetical protein
MSCKKENTGKLRESGIKPDTPAAAGYETCSKFPTDVCIISNQESKNQMDVLLIQQLKQRTRFMCYRCRSLKRGADRFVVE